MKNPKTFTLLSVIVAVLVLGVVYAALSEDLKITTSATVAPDSSNFKVVFTGSSVQQIITLGADATEANKGLVTMGQSGTTASLTVAAGALKKVGDSVTVYYHVTNQSKDLNAILGEISITDAAKSEYIKFSAAYDGNTELGPSESTGIYVTAILAKSPSDSNITATANIKITATSSESNVGTVCSNCGSSNMKWEERLDSTTNTVVGGRWICADCGQS